MQESFARGAFAPEPRTLIDVLRASAAADPEASALEDAEGALSYAELLSLVWQTAERLHACGVRRGDRVGVRMASGERRLYLAILGVLAAGAAYVPVDADDPQERADLVFGEAQVRGVIGGDGSFRLPDGSVAPHGEDLFAGDPPAAGGPPADPLLAFLRSDGVRRLAAEQHLADELLDRLAGLVSAARGLHPAGGPPAAHPAAGSSPNRPIFLARITAMIKWHSPIPTAPILSTGFLPTRSIHSTAGIVAMNMTMPTTPVASKLVVVCDSPSCSKICGA